MTSNRSRSRRRMRLAVTAAVIAVAVIALFSFADAVSRPADVSASGSQTCVNGVVPLNPYVTNCNLPPRGEQVIGAAPDAGAIINCRHVPACVAWYVNYPGTVLVPGYRP